MEQRQPWFKFCPQDWLGDELLRSCLPATRGFWMDCLCIMHRATPRGYLLVNGQQPTDRELATMTGMTVREMRTAREEVTRKGVCGVTEAGAIFSRRMVRDTAFSALQAKRVATRYQSGSTETLPESKSGSTGTLPKSTRSQRPKIQKDQEPPLPPQGARDDGYERFTQAYPAARRVGGKLAKRAFVAAMQGKNGAHLDAMLTALEQHKRSEQWQRGIVPLMTTWLNQERWAQVLPERLGVERERTGVEWLWALAAEVEDDTARWALKHVCHAEVVNGCVRLIVPAKYRPALDAERARLEQMVAVEIVEGEP